MADIQLIIMPKFSGINMWGNIIPYPSLGMACLGAYLKNKGINVECMDLRLMKVG